MKSNPDPSMPLDEIALSLADREAMRHAAEQAKRMSGQEYLHFLESASAHIEPSRRTSAGWTTFDLQDGVLTRQ